jgi:hypothetical protein
MGWREYLGYEILPLRSVGRWWLGGWAGAA